MSPKRGANETPCRGSAKALPYNFTATSTVGEGCSPLGRRHEVTEGEASPPRNAPPETFVEMTFKSGADQSFRRVRRLSTYRTFPTHATQMRSQSHRRGRRPDDPQDDGRILYRKRKIRNIRFCQANEVTRVRWSSLRKRTSPQRTLYFDPTPYRGSSTVALSQEQTCVSALGALLHGSC